MKYSFKNGGTVPTWYQFPPFLLSTFAIITAAYLQHRLSMPPCSLCVLQRYAYVVHLGWSMINMIWNCRMSHFFHFIWAIASTVLAVYHVFIFYTPSVECAPDPVANFLNESVFARLLPGFFEVEAYCSADSQILLGIPIAVWSFFMMLSILFFVGIRCCNTQKN